MTFNFECLRYRPKVDHDYRPKIDVTAPIESESPVATRFRRAGVILPEVISETTTRVQFDRDSFLELWLERSSIMSIEAGLSDGLSNFDYLAFQDVWSMVSEQIDAPAGLELLPVGAGCCYCECQFVIERPDGLECWDCLRMAWMDLGDSIARADFAEIVL